MQKIPEVTVILPSKPSSKDSDYRQLAICNSPEAAKELAVSIYNMFEALNIYGKKPESLTAIAQAFHRTLGDCNMDDTRKALDVWMRRESTFPTPADIYGLIERGGKPPLSDSMYVNLSKKHTSDRTPDDWQYMREYELYQRSGNSENNLAKTQKDNDFLTEANARLKKIIIDLETKNQTLEQRVVYAEKKKEEVKTDPIDKIIHQINRTAEYMRGEGMIQDNIQKFVNQELTKVFNLTENGISLRG